MIIMLVHSERVMWSINDQVNLHNVMHPCLLKKVPTSFEDFAAIWCGLHYSLCSILIIVWTFVLLNWRISQVIPVYKEGPPTDPATLRLVSLTSVQWKFMENCLKPLLTATAPSPEIAQGGFHESCGTLDQPLGIHELCHLHLYCFFLTSNPPMIPLIVT